MSPSPTPIVPIGSTDLDAADAIFERFLGEVAYQQLAEWLPEHPHTILDVSRHCPRLLALMLDQGHTVVHAEPYPQRLGSAPPRGGEGEPGKLLTVTADRRLVDWVGDRRIDAVVAEGGSLSEALAAELSLDDLHRVLRPGGRLLLCVDSLVAGLARLADQGRWAELADVPAADVVLIPGADGSFSRCFWPEELHSILTASGFAVEWVRPRSVLAVETVTRALQLDPQQLGSLVTTELALAVRRQGESVGGQLVASAVRT
ncbi:MAG: hypothetical protein QOJ03_1383 [Frankiaceae bacterium]|jgi:hypothetical protein|nr:hypothetical protein [Frankiaceae bacterium]